MNFESFEHNQEKISYSDELEKTLAVKEIVDELEKELDIFLQHKDKGGAIKNELDTLRLIKLFIYREQDKIMATTSQSTLSGFDCLTLSIITCLLAKRKGYDVKIGRPDKISRYFHSLIIKQDGEMFKVTGKNRKYDVIEMKINDVVARLKSFKSIIDIVDSAKKHLKNL